MMNFLANRRRPDVPHADPCGLSEEELERLADANMNIRTDEYIAYVPNDPATGRDGSSELLCDLT